MSSSNSNGANAAVNVDKYRSLVIDSGPIIKLTGISSLREKAEQFYTVPAVLNEIRDAKARHHLENLPFDIVTREPSPESIHAVTEFARLTGDYRSLSKVDILVLALVYELEREGCGGSIDHIRTKPKRTCGVGKIELLNPNANSNKGNEEKEVDNDYDIVEDDDEDSDKEESENDEGNSGFFQGKTQIEEEKENSPAPASAAPRSWAMLVNPSLASTEVKRIHTTTPIQINIDVGQFSDAEEEAAPENEGDNEDDVEKELQKDFPSLAASLHVPYEGEEDEFHAGRSEEFPGLKKEDEEGGDEEERKREAQKPLSKSGKVYNSFRGYGKLFKPAPPKKVPAQSNQIVVEEQKPEPVPDADGEERPAQSRIMGGMNMSGQEMDIEDDGEGWVTCTRDIRSLQAVGTLAPPKGALDNDVTEGPALNKRAACATTDFAMQNVILQMNLELLSVDGVKIRKLKSWVTRCGACFKVYTRVDDSGPHGMKRLFCERCGSDMLQRIAASVDGKTGRLRLHMSKKHKKNLRGTKFSLPKPGTGDRFQGDLLLREDQLLMGAWNQKVKMRSGGKAKSAAQSMFGQDIAANVGCKAQSMNVDDITTGFGRRNPNAAKGRERRGKKKKSKEKACGLRRYH